VFPWPQLPTPARQELPTALTAPRIWRGARAIVVAREEKRREEDPGSEIGGGDGQEAPDGAPEREFQCRDGEVGRHS